MSYELFENLESEVRSYCRSFPEVFSSASGCYIQGENGRQYLDFFAGAGALCFGHNPPPIMARVIDYISNNGILHGLDMFTQAKRDLLQAIDTHLLAPKKLDYRIQFCGPTGTNAVEAALKLARKVTGRSTVFAFHGGFHGMTLGSLACTGNSYNRKGAGVSLDGVRFMPYPYGPYLNMDSIAYIEAVLSDPSSGVDKPAAMLVETVQAEGGVVVAPVTWLQQLRALCDRHDILLIVDDIQVGCGRTGQYFSFERAGIVPDMVTLSKAISGCGLPLAMVLIKPQYDQWQPGEHNGTFRGNQLAFVSAAAGLEFYASEAVEQQVAVKAPLLEQRLSSLVERFPELQLRGIGMIWGLDFQNLAQPELIDKVTRDCFDNGLIIENAGRHGQVLKLLPPLTITEAELLQGVEIIEQAIGRQINLN